VFSRAKVILTPDSNLIVIYQYYRYKKTKAHNPHQRRKRGLSIVQKDMTGLSAGRLAMYSLFHIMNASGVAHTAIALEKWKLLQPEAAPLFNDPVEMGQRFVPACVFIQICKYHGAK